MSDTIAELRLLTEELRKGIAVVCKRLQTTADGVDRPIRGIAAPGPIKPELDRE